MDNEEQVVKQGTSAAPSTPATTRPQSTASPKAARRGKGGGQQAGQPFYFGEQISKSRSQQQEDEQEEEGKQREKSRRLRTETERERRLMLLEIFKAVHSRRGGAFSQ